MTAPVRAGRPARGATAQGGLQLPLRWAGLHSEAGRRLAPSQGGGLQAAQCAGLAADELMQHLGLVLVVDRATDARRVIEEAGYEYRAAIGLTDLGLA